MLLSSISPFHSTVSNLNVQPTLTSDVQSIHPYDASTATSKLSVTATSSNAIGTCTVYTMFPNSTMSCHSFTTVDFTCIHEPGFPTTPKHPSITYRFYQGIWL